jgi:pSer/pThr/pTyr-binding forkhead associated (FHA) protein
LDAFCSLCGASMYAKGGAPDGARAGKPRSRGFLVLPGGERLEVAEAALVVGRAQLQGVLAKGELGRVSRAHFSIGREGGGFVLQDGGTVAQPKQSLNGTWVGRGEAEPKVRAFEGAPLQLAGGEAIDIAHVVTVRFVVERG